MNNLLPKSEGKVKKANKQETFSLLNASNEMRPEQQESNTVLLESAR
jgi:hypothetical protein